MYEQVAAMAAQLHALYCTAYFPSDADPVFSVRHHDVDRDKARFVVQGLEADGWRLVPAGAFDHAIARERA